MTNHNSIDSRLIPSTLPDQLLRATTYAREIRASPALRAYSEALIAARCDQELGLPVNMASWDPVEIARFKKLIAGEAPPELLTAIDTANFRISPLTAALVLGHARRDEFNPANHLRVVSDAICDAMNGRGPRFIIVNMPPRHGKSHLCSRRTPSFFIGNFPFMTCAVIGYGELFSEVWGRMTRNDLLDSPELFGFGLAPDSTAASHWSTAHGGGLWTAGVGGSVTGRSADILILDDPVKDSNAANSVRERDQLFSWFLSGARTRLYPWSVCLIVMTRWHSDDLAGRLLSGFGGTDATEWREIRMPAIWESNEPDVLGRKHGDALWPSRFSAAELDLTRRSVGPDVWSSLFQSEPADLNSTARVYHAFTDDNIREVEYDPRCVLAVALDFNCDPGSALILQIRDGFGPHPSTWHEKIVEFQVLDEISIGDSHTRMIVEECDARLRKILAGRAPVPVTIFGDSSGNSRRSSSTETDWEIVENIFGRAHSFYHATCSVPESNPNVKDRTNVVNGALRNGDKQIRLLIDPKCRQLILDMRLCKWKRDTSGNVTSLIDKSDSRRTHVSDALGYCVHRHFKVGSQVFGEMPGLMR